MALHFKSPLDRLMPLLLAFICFSSANLHAGASNKNGNPFGNGTFFQNSGTFSAVIRGENLSGTMLFSTGVSSSTNAASTNSSGGSSLIVYEGNTYQGNASGMWDPSQGTIFGQFWGGQRLSGTNTMAFYPEIFNTNNFPALIPVVTNQIQNVIQVVTNSTLTVIGTNADGSTIISTNITISTITVGTTNALITNYVAIEPIGTNYSQDGVYMNGNFDGYVQNKYPNQTFSANGTVLQQQLAAQPIWGSTNSGPPQLNGAEGTMPMQVVTTTIPVTVQGIRISDAYTSFAAINNSSNVPYSTTYYTVTNPPQ